MSDAARRKERRRLKREKKKAQMRRASSGSPYKIIGRTGHIEACYINADWKAGGMGMIHLIRYNPQGGIALACFQIDFWCAGLKDAWGALDLLREGIDRHLERARDRFELLRIEPDEARSLVAGAIRFARQNGFLLPHRYERWVQLLGNIPDPATADLRSFGKDGKLLWVGPIDDLIRRLIAGSAERFFARPDVEFIYEPDEFDWRLDDGDDFDDDAPDDGYLEDDAQDDGDEEDKSEQASGASGIAQP